MKDERRSVTGEDPCQPLDYSYNNPLDLSRTKLSNPAARCHQSLVKAGRNFNLSNFQTDWSDDVEGQPWRYNISHDLTTPPTVDLSQSGQDQQDQDRQPAEVSLSEGQDHRVSRGVADSEELFVFKAPRSEIQFLTLWSFSVKSKNQGDISRYSPSGQAVRYEQSNLLEGREDREDYIEPVDQTVSDSGLLLEHENSILCDPELQIFPISPHSQSQLKPSDNTCQELVFPPATPSLTKTVHQEIPSLWQIPVSESESGRAELLDDDDDLMIDLP